MVDDYTYGLVITTLDLQEYIPHTICHMLFTIYHIIHTICSLVGCTLRLEGPIFGSFLAQRPYYVWRLSLPSGSDCQYGGFQKTGAPCFRSPYRRRHDIFGVYIRAPDLWKLPYRGLTCFMLLYLRPQGFGRRPEPLQFCEVCRRLDFVIKAEWHVLGPQRD